MRSKSMLIVTLSIIVVFFTIIPEIYADNSEVLPKGVFNADVRGRFFFNIDQTYDDSGSKRSAAWKYNTNMNTNVFPALKYLELPPPYGFGMPAGSVSLGSSVVSFTYKIQEYELRFNYGITDSLSAGVFIPYRFIKNEVSAQLDTTNATVGKNPGIPGITAPFVPIAGFGGIKLTANDVINLLQSQFGYKRFETWSDDGIVDVEAGFKYMYLKTDNWRFSATAGVRFPTGKTDDQDNLVDYPFGTGSYAALFRLSNDYIGTKGLTLDLTLKYDLYFAHHQTLRILTDANQPISNNKQYVWFKPGDVFGIEAEARYSLSKCLTGNLIYKFNYGYESSLSGPGNFNYHASEDQTDFREHIGIVGLQYSALPLYKEKKFPVPMYGGISYRNRFAGMNALASQYIELQLGVFF